MSQSHPGHHFCLISDCLAGDQVTLNLYGWIILHLSITGLFQHWNILCWPSHLLSTENKTADLKVVPLYQFHNKGASETNYSAHSYLCILDCHRFYLSDLLVSAKVFTWRWFNYITKSLSLKGCDIDLLGDQHVWNGSISGVFHLHVGQVYQAIEQLVEKSTQL